jgi:glutaredoxin
LRKASLRKASLRKPYKLKPLQINPFHRKGYSDKISLVKKVSDLEKVQKKCEKEERWELYTMDGCGHCITAKEFLEKRVKKNPDCVKLKVERGAENPEIVDRFKEYGDTWPKIVLNREYIGGNNDLEKKFGENK